MAMLPDALNQVDAFFRSLKAKSLKASDAQFCYLATKINGVFGIAQAKLLFNSLPAKALTPHFQSENIRAGVYFPKQLKLSPRQIVEQLTTGMIETPHGKLHFFGNDANNYGAHYQELSQEGLKNQSRVETLTIYGGPNQEFLQRRVLFDWELKAASTPYDNMGELAFDYLLSDFRDVCQVECVLFNIAMFDFGSTITGNKATIRAILKKGLPTKELTIGYRVFSGGNIIKRAQIRGADMEWAQLPQRQHGTIELEVPNAAVLNCSVNFRGVAQHHGWVGDPATMQNPRRAAYEVFDKKLITLTDIITNAHVRGRDARDLEAGVAWLLWMLGFSVAQIGGLPRTQQDFSDLIVTTPSGHFIVVECTTGLLKANHKLPLLIQRAELVRQAIIASNNQHLRVLSAMVTSKARNEIVAEIGEAEKHGVLVATAETVARAIERTLLLPNADAMFAEFEEAANTKKAAALGAEMTT